MSKLLIIVLTVIVAGGFAVTPRPQEEQCKPNTIDCGFDVGGTDREIIQSYGVPLITFQKKTSREYTGSCCEVVTFEKNDIKERNIGIYVVLALGVSLAGILVTGKKRYENSRN